MSTSSPPTAPDDLRAGVDLTIDLADPRTSTPPNAADNRTTQNSQNDETQNGQPTHALAESLAESPERRPARAVVRATWLVALADAAGLALPAAFMQHGRLAIGAFALLAVGAYHGAGLYKPRLHLSVLSELPLLATRAVLAAVLCGAGVQVLALNPGLNTFALDVAVAFALQVTFRSIAYQLVRGSRETGRVCHPTLVIGGGRRRQPTSSAPSRTPAATASGSWAWSTSTPSPTRRRPTRSPTSARSKSCRRSSPSTGWRCCSSPSGPTASARSSK